MVKYTSVDSHTRNKQRAFFITGMISLFLLASFYVSAQDMKSYTGQWESDQLLQKNISLELQASLDNQTSGELTLKSKNGYKKYPFTLDKKGQLRVALDSLAFFNAYLDSKTNTIRGFINSGIWQYHVSLLPSSGHLYKGNWNPLLIRDIASKFYLSVENGNADQYEAYGFIADVRFPGFGCGNFSKNQANIRFNDMRTGLAFQGSLDEKMITLEIDMVGIKLCTLNMRRSDSEWVLKPKPKPVVFSSSVIAVNDGIPTGTLKQAGLDTAKLRKMVDSIEAGAITNTHSVLIARNGKLVYEQYFSGYDAPTPHDTRSSSKSISSAITGIAIDQGILKDTAVKLASLLPENYRKIIESNPLKQSISIGNLLTMSSGLDAIDFGTDRKTAASEDNYQNSADWLKTVLEAPMIHTPGTHANYSSANPYLIGVALAGTLHEPLNLYIDKNLFAKLGIDNYLLQNDDKKNPYFGGGMYLRSRDLLKFGLLYASYGRWKDQQVISKSWVEASTKKFLKLENHQQKNDYGFLWWHYHYAVGNQQIQTIEARGAGGQYIFIIPKYQLTVVVTSGNFRNGRVWQPEKIVSDYILPAIENP